MSVTVKSTANPRVTMMDVARAAKVSQTTVSLVLNEVEGARVAAETRLAVLQAAENLGYGLRRDRGAGQRADLPVLAFLADQIATDPWISIAIDGARERAWERGYLLSVAITAGDVGAERAALSRWPDPTLGGIIYGTINTREITPPEFPNGVPVILLNCYAGDRSLPSIVPGEVAGGHTATERLLASGHHRIGFIGGEPWMDASKDRLKGYRQALAMWDLPFDPALVRHGDWEPSSGYEQTKLLLELDRPPSAIFCCNDLMAFGCYDALRERGLAIPNDVAVIGYDDREIAQHMHPPLTTILLPHHEMGALAADTLIDVGFQGSGRSRQIKVECPIVVRASA